ncbi:MAG: GNAT family N-acetyltransferase [Bacteroidales bacterium]|nr:GNAT family N-acetyltransferase [Bacteroidales bacterium]
MIKFRNHKREDIQYRVQWLNNPKANIFIGEKNSKTTRTKQSKWFDDYEKNKNKKFFTICDENKPIGFMGLSHIDKVSKKAEVFIIIGDDNYRGKGYGKKSLKYLINYGFNMLRLEKIYLGVYEKNKSAIFSYKSVGFKVEGIFKKDTFLNGKYYNLVMMAIFKDSR